MTVLDQYLNYLHESDNINEAGGFNLGTEVHGGLVSGLKWGLVIIPAMIASWKLANVAFSKATRKCGGIKKGTPGFKVCVARERIKALQQKINVSQQILSKCAGSKNPEMCKQTFELEIEKDKNRININRNKVQELLGEQYKKLQEQGALGSIAGLAVTIAAQTVVDKAIFLIMRTVQGLFKASIRKCGVYKQSTERDLCISKIKIESLQNNLSKLTPLLNQCKRDKNPARCQEKVQHHISKITRDIQIEKDNITAYSNQIELNKREAALKDQMKAEKKSGKIKKF